MNLKDLDELQKLRVEVAKDIYVHNFLKDAINTNSKVNFEDNFGPANQAFKHADYFIAASLKETLTLKALNRRINKKQEMDERQKQTQLKTPTSWNK